MHFDIAAYRPAAKTPYARPVEVGGFSRIDGEQHFDKRALRRYRAPKLPNSLATGYSDFVPKRDDKDAAEKCLLAAVERYAEQTSKAHFVTYRNNLNKLFATLHCPNDDWCIGVKRLTDQRWLLSVRDTRRRRDEELSQSDAQRLMSYFGYRFEALCTGHDPSTPIDANDEYVGLFNCKLGSHRLAVCRASSRVKHRAEYYSQRTLQEYALLDFDRGRHRGRPRETTGLPRERVRGHYLLLDFCVSGRLLLTNRTPVPRRH